jgi:hypothetical protein
MAALPLNSSLDSEVNAIEDLTADEVGDIGLWIGQQKQYRNVPNFVANELCQRTSALLSRQDLCKKRPFFFCSFNNTL